MFCPNKNIFWLKNRDSPSLKYSNFYFKSKWGYYWKKKIIYIKKKYFLALLKLKIN